MGNMSHNCIPDCLKYCWLFIFVFQKAFPFMLITYYSKMADYTFANRDEIFIFFSLPDPSRFWLLQLSPLWTRWLTAIQICAQFCPTLCDPMECSLPNSSVHGILQTRIVEWVAISVSRGSSRLALAGGFFTAAPPRTGYNNQCFNLFSWWFSNYLCLVPFSSMLLSRFSRVRLCATP